MGNSSAMDAHDEAYCPTCNNSFSIEVTHCPNDNGRLIKLAAKRDEMIGRVLDGRYEIRAPLGQGGMGAVYIANQISVDRDVAIKIVHPRYANDREAVKRFMRESRLASRLTSASIVAIYDFGQSDGVLFLAMELVQGKPLADVIGSGLSLSKTIGVGMQLCDALEAAHAQGIVHRDLKPGNVIVVESGACKVLDFGLAKSLGGDSAAHSAVTQENAMLGTPRYMAPEQFEGKDIDGRADLYALGCILFECITGAPPFVDHQISALVARHLTEEPPPLPAGVPPALKTLVEKLLAKSRDDRPANCAAIRDALTTARGQLKYATNPAIVLPPTGAFAAAATPAPSTMAPALAPKKRTWIYAAGAAALVATIGIVIAVSSSSPTPPRTPLEVKDPASNPTASTGSASTGSATSIESTTKATTETPTAKVETPTSAKIDGPSSNETAATSKTASAKVEPANKSVKPVTKSTKGTSKVTKTAGAGSATTKVVKTAGSGSATPKTGAGSATPKAGTGSATPKTVPGDLPFLKPTR